jgi:putative membrane protein
LSSFGYRLYNELPTLALIAIVMLAVWKSLAGLGIGVVVLLSLGLLFFAAARLYRRYRGE